MDKLLPFLNASGNKNWQVVLEEGRESYSIVRGLLINNRENIEKTTSAYINWEIFSGDCFYKPGVWTSVHDYNIPLADSPLCFSEDCFDPACFSNENNKYFYNPITNTYTPILVGDNPTEQIPLIPVSIDPFVQVIPYLSSLSIDSEYISVDNIHFVVRVYKPVLKTYNHQIGVQVYKRLIREDECLSHCIFSDLKLIKEIVYDLDNIENNQLVCDNSAEFTTEEVNLAEQALSIHLLRLINKQTESYLLGLDINNNAYYYNGEILDTVSYSNTFEVKEIIIRGKTIKYIQINNKIYIWQEGNVFENSYVLTVDIGLSNGLGEEIVWVENNIPVDYSGRFTSTKRIPYENVIRVYKFNYIYRDSKQLAGLYYSEGNNILKNNTLLYRDLTLLDQASNLEELCFGLLLLLDTDYQGKDNEYTRAYHQHPYIKQLIESHIEIIHSFIGPDNSIPKSINTFVNPVDIYDDVRFKKLIKSCLDTSILEQGDCNIFDDEYIADDKFICSGGCGGRENYILLNTREVDNASLAYYWLLLVNYERVYSNTQFNTYATDIKQYFDNNINKEFFLVNEGWESSDIWVNRLAKTNYSFKTNTLLFICYMQWAEIRVDPYAIKTASKIYSSLQDNYYLLSESKYKHNSLDQLVYGLLFSYTENRQEQLQSYKEFIRANTIFDSGSKTLIIYDEDYVYTDEEEYLLTYTTEKSEDINTIVGFPSLTLNPITKTILANIDITKSLTRLLDKFDYRSLIEEVNRFRQPRLNFFSIYNWQALYKYQLAKEDVLQDLRINTPIGEQYFSREALERGEVSKLYKGLASELALDYVKEDYININTYTQIRDRQTIFNTESLHNQSIKEANRRAIDLYSNNGINVDSLQDYIKDYGLDKLEVRETAILGVHTDNDLLSPYLLDAYIEGDGKYLGQYEIDVYEGPISIDLFNGIRNKLSIGHIPNINEYITVKDFDTTLISQVLSSREESSFVPITIEPVCCALNSKYKQCNNGVLYRINYLEQVYTLYAIYKGPNGELTGLYSPLPNYTPIKAIMPITNSNIQYTYLKV